MELSHSQPNPTSQIRCSESATSWLATAKRFSSFVIELNMNARRRAKKEYSFYTKSLGVADLILSGIGRRFVISAIEAGR